MYLRTKLQPRAVTNLEQIIQRDYSGMRVTKGYVVSALLTDFKALIPDQDKLLNAIAVSDLKEMGDTTAVNLTITKEANEKLTELKKTLDNITGRSLFPAQVLDVLFICALNSTADGWDGIPEKDNKELARALLDLAYKLLTEEILSGNVKRARNEVVRILFENHLL